MMDGKAKNIRVRDKDKITRIAYILEAGFEYFMSLFVTGTMLGYVLGTLGLSDALQGIISTVATFACGAQLFALFLVEKKRKWLVTGGHLINESCFVLLYLLPICNLSPWLKTALVLVLLFVGHIISNAVLPVKMTWLMGSVQDSKRGRFTAVKEMISLAGGVAVSLSFGVVADVFRDTDGMPTKPYYIICMSALLLMMAIHTVTLLVSHEKEEIIDQRAPIKETICRLVKNKSLVKVIGVGILWDITSALSASFTASYVRGELGFQFTVIAIITTVGSICRIIVSPFLGKLADKHSFATSMTLAFIVVGTSYIVQVFTAPATRWLYLVSVCLHAFAMAGINGGVINLIYDYVVPAERAVAMGVKNALGGIFAFLTALISSVVLDKIQAAGGFKIFGFNLYAQQVLAFFSCVAVTLLIVYMRKVIAPLKRLKSKDETG